MTLDAMGTLLELVDPVLRLVAALASEGSAQDEGAAARALRAEIAHYRANLHRGGDPRSLRELRAECAAVLAANLDPPRPSDAAAGRALAVALAFRLHPEALAALDVIGAAGARVAVVSDWDVSLHETLADLGVADRLDAVVTSAEVGARKPDPRPFAVALAALGVDPAAAWHIGDSPALDCVGARAAGMRAVLVDRTGRAPADGGCRRAPDLLAATRIALGGG